MGDDSDECCKGIFFFSFFFQSTDNLCFLPMNDKERKRVGDKNIFLSLLFIVLDKTPGQANVERVQEEREELQVHRSKDAPDVLALYTDLEVGTLLTLCKLGASASVQVSALLLLWVFW